MLTHLCYTLSVAQVHQIVRDSFRIQYEIKQKKNQWKTFFVISTRHEHKFKRISFKFKNNVKSIVYISNRYSRHYIVI